VGLLDNFEQRLDQLVNGPFQRAFKDVVEPVEIASRIQREMDKRSAIISRGRIVVPNTFTVELSTHDAERLHDLIEGIRLELISVVRDHATEQRYTFLGNVDVEITEDSALDTGVFRVLSATKADPSPPEQASAPLSSATEFTGHPHPVIGGKRFPLTQSRTRIGRGANVDVSLADPAVSRTHAEIILGIPPLLRDLGAANGTFLDGRKIAESPLHDGAEIKLGSTTMTFRSG